jgi:hypothetical protein
MNAKQTVVLTATVVALVVVVTLIKVGLPSNKEPQGPKMAPPLDKPHLTFDQMEQKAGTWLVAGPASPLSTPNDVRPPEQERGSNGHHDYWFRNENDQPVELFVTKLSCNRCLHFDVALAPEGFEATRAAAAAGLGPAAAVAGAVQAAPVPGPDAVWQTLESQEHNREAKGFTVPPHRGGWARLAWTDEEAGVKLLYIDLRTESPAGNAPPVHLQYGAVFVEPVRVLPENKELSVENLRSGDRPGEAWFVVYSSTRPEFRLEPQPDDVQQKRHPFVTCGKPLPLTRALCDEVQGKIKSVVLSGYRVPVYVRARLDDGREHDLGPFRTLIGLTSDALENNLGLLVTGTVVGDIKVFSGADDGGPDSRLLQDRLNLGTFDRSRGVTKRATVEAPVGTALEVEKAPDFLQVSLDPEKPPEGARLQTWSLTATIPPNKVSGRFPNLDDPALRDTAIYLKSKDRRVRIPVGGVASQR